MMQVTDDLIRSVVQEVLSHMRNGKAAPTNEELIVARQAKALLEAGR